MNKTELKQLLDSQDFYEVMYAYRIANMNNQLNVVNKFTDVKTWIIDKLFNFHDEQLTDEQINDLMVAALEGGINFWCGSVTLIDGSIPPEQVDNFEYLSDVISLGGTLCFHDAESSDKWELTKDKFLKGIEKTLEWGNFKTVQGLFDNHDAETADVIIQFALFDEIVFG